MLTIKITLETLKLIEEKYKDYITDRNIGYILFVAKFDGNIITVYDNNKKNYYKMTIQGQDPMSIAKLYSMDEKICPKKAKIEKESPYFIDVDNQIGSDEVGTGDFLGPIIVCSAFVNHETMKLIKEQGITDSKKLSDEKILEIVPALINKVYYISKVLTNDRYNNATNKGFNMNQIKAVLHNYCLVNLHKKMPYVQNVYVDKFCDEKLYYQYLSQSKEVEKHIVFKEKGETYFPSVALASCIARYLFLKEIATLNEKYKVKIPLGASAEVDKFAIEFIKKYGENEFLKICKSNFKNYQKIKEQEQEKLF